MNKIETNIEGLFVFEPNIFGDHRGYFFESYNKDKFNDFGLDFDFVQDNEAMSSRGVLRGLHFQLPPFSQTKLIRAIVGEIIDVVVDLRKDSKTYGKHYSIILNEQNKKQLLVPKGFAHGYAVLSENAIVAYKVDEKYMPSHECSLLWNDESFNIDWKLSDTEVLLSEKDKNAITFNEFTSPF